jgi:hypothetical protein
MTTTIAPTTKQGVTPNGRKARGGWFTLRVGIWGTAEL